MLVSSFCKNVHSRVPLLRTTVHSKFKSLIADLSTNSPSCRLFRLFLAPGLLRCRKYCDDGSSKPVRLPKLLPEATPRLWPHLFKTIHNFIQINYIVRKRLDPEFNLNDFMDGTKQAVSIVSQALAEENYEALDDLVRKEALDAVRPRIETLTPEQKALIAVNTDDIYLAFPFEVGIMFDEDDKDEKRFVEITMIYHILRGLTEMRERGIEPPLNMGLDPKYQELMFICNYRFIREYTKGVDSSWTVNMINHFMPVDLYRS